MHQGPDSEPQEWLDLSESLLRFLRERDLVTAPDKGIWLFKANALDQLAAFMQKKMQDRRPAYDLPGNQAAE